MRRIINSMLSSISPAQLKKYGIYAVLSFFISFCVIIAVDDIGVRNADMQHERWRNEHLQQMLDDQSKLRYEQDSLMRIIMYKHINQPRGK